jgi:hypothetical protein
MTVEISLLDEAAGNTQNSSELSLKDVDTT